MKPPALPRIGPIPAFRSLPLRILLVEDEPELAGAIEVVLRANHHVVDHVAEGLGAWSLLGSDLASYDLLILDWMLPGL